MVPHVGARLVAYPPPRQKFAARSERHRTSAGRALRFELKLMGLDLSASYLFANFLVSGVGFVLFRYGRKMSRMPHAGIGLVLMVFPYFVPSALLMIGIAALLCGLLYMAARAGY
jgi:hypothetical protein